MKVWCSMYQKLDVFIEFLKGQTVKTWKKQVDRNSI